jgi:hypothetical protein
LVEAPIAEPTSLRLAELLLASGSDSTEFFDGDSSVRCECLGNDLFRDEVIRITLVAGLPSRHAAKAGASGSTVSLLVGSTSTGVSFAGGID